MGALVESPDEGMIGVPLGAVGDKIAEEALVVAEDDPQLPRQHGDALYHVAK